MSDPTVERLRDLAAKIDAHAGWQVEARIRRLRRGQYILRGNTGELLEAFQVFGHPETALPLWSVNNQDAFNAFMAEVDRLLTNFLASVATLVEYDRRIMRSEYEGTKLWDSYNEVVAARFDDGQLLFVRGLRNYTSHYDLPGSFGNMQWTRTSWESRVMLDCPRLLKWSGWKPAAREFLTNEGEQVDLANCVGAYADAVDQLHDWIENALRDEHAAELAEFRALAVEHDALVDELNKPFESMTPS